MLSSVCVWKYGMQPMEFLDQEQLHHLHPGAIIARVAMRELPWMIRQGFQPVHYGGIVDILPPWNDEKEKKDDSKEKKIAQVLDLLSRILVIHWVKDHKSHISVVRQTNMLYFLWGKTRVTVKDFKNLDLTDAEGWGLCYEGLSRREQIVTFIKETLGKTNYSFFRNNCEHWMTQVTTGGAHITSVQVGAGLSFLTALCATSFAALYYTKSKAKAQQKRLTASQTDTM